MVPQEGNFQKGSFREDSFQEGMQDSLVLGMVLLAGSFLVDKLDS